MADILEFQPSLNLASSDRNRAGYYNVMKDMISSLQEQLQAFGTLEYDDDNYMIYLVPFGENISSFTIKWSVTDAKYYVVTLRLSGSSSDVIADSLTADRNPKFFFYFNPNNETFFMGFNERKCWCGWSKGHTYDGLELPFIFTYQCHVHSTNQATYVAPSGSYNRENTNSTAYCVKPWTAMSLGLINSILYYLDGGVSLPGDHSYIYINDEPYIATVYNMVIKL